MATWPTPLPEGPRKPAVKAQEEGGETSALAKTNVLPQRQEGPLLISFKSVEQSPRLPRWLWGSRWEWFLLWVNLLILNLLIVEELGPVQPDFKLGAPSPLALSS